MYGSEHRLREDHAKHQRPSPSKPLEQQCELDRQKTAIDDFFVERIAEDLRDPLADRSQRPRPLRVEAEMSALRHRLAKVHDGPQCERPYDCGGKIARS